MHDATGAVSFLDLSWECGLNVGTVADLRWRVVMKRRTATRCGIGLAIAAGLAAATEATEAQALIPDWVGRVTVEVNG